MTYHFDFGAVLAHWPLLLEGVWTTLRLTLFSTVFGILIGAFCAVIRTGGPTWARAVVSLYVEFIRNTPLLVQSYFLIFGIASLGIRLPILIGATIALTVNIGAYTTEIVRAGIESIHRGQLEAATCLGLSRTQTYLHVIIRPALERVYPALASQYVLLMLASSIVSSVGVEELFGMSNRIQSETFRNFEIFVVLGVIYLLLAVLVRTGFALLGLAIFPRRRKLGTPL
ncbi:MULTISPECIES: amino acid ABC transporter permease [unclassified Bradyrhizobium]|uniref:amino acid ABC transporter permease n=1 Tax=unclassified Bradyrhizobium TaxID=2631580 RepID=UPI002448E37E|nr:MULTISPECIES: amino acid ABC transporter permease [unclassified Bradyrhizobium]MDH2346120.1 amino acid ABC transporter permease [Bradyrhizobium sp. SSUT77]MDH2350508.1 amino acid ABC transporter permease [Bradyrhizobium sp. SSUT112]